MHAETLNAHPNTYQVADTLKLKINGAQLAVARRPSLTELELPLRGVALSDSPVLVRAQHDDDRAHVVGRLHALGRRRSLPLHYCRSVGDLRKLVLMGATGTWALCDVGTWSIEDQRALAQLIGMFDEYRLHGHLSHERIPRVVVVERPDRVSTICGELSRRLSFFDIAIS
jgi:hypothetical protein